MFTIINRGRIYLQDSGLDAKWWPYAAKYATYVLNRSPAGRVKTIPEDRWRSTTTLIKHLRPFGENLLYRNHTESDKLAPHYIPGRLLGFVENTTNYIVLNQSNKVSYSRNVIFEKPDMDTVLEFSPKCDEPRILPTIELDKQKIELIKVEPLPTPMEQQSSPPIVPRKRLIPVVELPAPRRAVNPPSSDSEEDEDDTGDGIIESQPQRSACIAKAPTVHQALIHAALNTSHFTPTTYNEAHCLSEWPQWQAAIDKELSKMDKYSVWDVKPRRTGQRVLKAQWVFTRKINGETGQPSAYKARWVAKGYSQVAGLDYNKLYAGVAYKDTI